MDERPGAYIGRFNCRARFLWAAHVVGSVAVHLLGLAGRAVSEERMPLTTDIFSCRNAGQRSPHQPQFRHCPEEPMS